MSLTPNAAPPSRGRVLVRRCVRHSVPWLLVALLWPLAWLPLRVTHALGGALGALIATVPNRQRRNALINLALCLPQATPAATVRLRNRSLREFGKTYLESARLWLRSPVSTLALVREVRGLEWLRRPAGQGAIVLSPHLGAWELAGLFLSAQGPTTIFYKPQRYADALIQAARRRGGATLAPIGTHGIRALTRALARGEAVGILPDQAPRAERGARAFFRAVACGCPPRTRLSSLSAKIRPSESVSQACRANWPRPEPRQSSRSMS